MTDSFLLANTLDAIDLRYFHQIYCNSRDDISLQVEALLNNVGFRQHHILKMVRRELGANIRAQSPSFSGEIFDRYGRLSAAFVGARAYNSIYKTPIDESKYILLAPASDNTWADSDFPSALSFGSRRTSRPSLRLYTEKQATVYADCCGFQVYTSDLSHFFATGSPFCYSNAALSVEEIELGDVVVIADIFNGANFCHFLFDWLGRIAQLQESHVYMDKNVRYLAGGIPGPINRLLVDLTCEVLNLSAEQFIFPRIGTVIRSSGDVCWFSDAYEENLHPGQLMHPQTVRFLDDLAIRVRDWAGSNRDSPERIYISREDAKSRRLSNEPAIRKVLVSLGFQVVELANLSLSEQIRIVSGASSIVAPHGMGLTHLAFNAKKPNVVELFHPQVGTDAYAMLARAKGINYKYLLGNAAEALDFIVSPGELEDTLSN